MDLQRFTDQTAGVLTLVSLTATVVWGLVATGRTVLGPRGRLLAQAVHRATAVGALGFLLVHITVKTAEAHATVLAALLPFAGGVRGAGGLVGLGSLAAHLMVLAAATGTLRSVFAGRARAARRWHALHGCAYAAWCAAVLHGLNAGRPAAGWVTACYALSLAAAAAALLIRRARRPLRSFLHLPPVRPRPAGAHAAGKEPPSRPLPVPGGRPGARIPDAERAGITSGRPS
ncbi:hypothetical protein ABZ442_05985 [Streptomyces triculaminicus]|uniref:hypothetical protein n=1 Tax=Streptomyces triculaminicus TaxID=2816232 RepID=UPI0033DCE588